MTGGKDSPRRRRVLFVTTAGERGGAEGVIELFPDRLASSEFEPVLAAPHDTPLLARWQARGWETAGMPGLTRLRRLDQVWPTIRGMARIMRERHIDLVYTHGVATQILAGLAARRARLLAISHVHDRFDARLTVDGFLHRLAVAAPRQATIMVSKNVAATYRGRLPDDRVEVIPNGVDSDLVTPVARPGGEAPFVVWCGRLQAWKGAHVFLNAARRVLATRPDVRFAVVGGTLFGLEPEYAPSLLRQVQQLQLSNAVQFVGQVDNARAWLAAASFVVHSSVTPDPFPLVVLEAMMQGRAVVAFDQGGPAEAIVDGESGRLVTPGDVNALAAAMLDLLNAPGIAVEMGRAARRRALTEYDADVMVRRVSATFDRVLCAV